MGLVDHELQIGQKHCTKQLNPRPLEHICTLLMEGMALSLYLLCRVAISG